MSAPEQNSTPVKVIIARMFLSGVAAVVLVLIVIKPTWLAHFISAILPDEPTFRKFIEPYGIPVVSQ